MALVLPDRVKETATTAGTGTFTLAGAVEKFQSFSAVGDGNTTYYCIQHETENEFEVGLGTYTASGTTLSRDTILTSTNSNNAVDFSAGDKTVFVVVPGDKTIRKDGSGAANITSSDVTTALGFTPISSADGGNAATLDGIDSTSFLRSDADDSVTGVITFPLTGFKISDQVTVSHSTDQTYKTLTIKNEGDDNEASIDGLSSDGTRQFMVYGGAQSQGFLHPVAYSWRLKIPLTGSLSRDNTYTIWDSGNDGSGSGLDADTLDGYHVNSDDRNNEANKVVRTQANGRIYGGQFYANDWFRLDGDQGLYWQARARGITSPEQQGNSYGNINTYGGGLNGWTGYGIFDDVVLMGRSNTDVGLHDNSFGWAWYWSYGNDSLGVGTSSTSSSYRLYVSGSIYATSNITAYSDRRIKENIVTIDEALDKVNALRGVYYNKRFGDDKPREIGVIAQEVQEVVPELVTYAEDVDEYGVKYANTVGLLIEAVKELTTKVKELEARCP